MRISKKVLCFLFVFFLVFVFAGCTKKEKTKENTEPAKTQEKTPTAKTTEPAVEESVSFTIKVIDIDGEELGSKEFKKDAPFDGSAKGALFALLKENFDVVYSESDYGPYITSINGSIVDANYYVSILENGEYSLVGVNDLVIDDGDVFEFKVVTWKEFDEVDLAVDQMIYSFLKNKVNDLFPATGFSYPLLAALACACSKTSYGASLYDTSVFNLDLDSKDAYITEYSQDLSNSENVSPLFKAALAKKCFGIENDTIETGLKCLDSNALNSLFYAPYYLMACALEGVDPASDVLAYYEDLFNYETPCDSLLIALQAYDLFCSEFDNYEDVVNEVLEKQEVAMTENGFNDEWGGINCASTAQLILTLVSIGYDPRSYNDLDMVSALLSYAKEGAFLYLSSDAEADLVYSTPQAFAALLAYKMYRDLGVNVNIYNID